MQFNVNLLPLMQVNVSTQVMQKALIEDLLTRYESSGVCGLKELFMFPYISL